MPPRWVWFAVFGPLVLCLTCSTLGYFVVWPNIDDLLDEQQQAVSREIADSIRLSLNGSLAGAPPDAPYVRIRDGDLDINNSLSSDGFGIETGTSGTFIYGFTTSITPNGIAVSGGEDVIYSSVPVVEDNRIMLNQADASSGFFELFLTDEGFASALETGINDALRDHGLQPTAITLSHGEMVIFTVPQI